MKRRAIVVDGPLAFRMRRLAAARDRELGLEILTLPQLAARLAGGFCRPAHEDVLFPAINTALEQGGYTQLDGVRRLPGMTRAVARTLACIWSADLNLDDLSVTSPRLADMAVLQRRIREALPAGALTSIDLRDAALARCSRASSLLGAVTLEGLMDVDPVWRPLIAALVSEIDVEWISVGVAERSWFPGRLPARPVPPSLQPRGALCADPRAEVVEALRWARELLSRGNIVTSDIALASASPDAWDEHFLVLAADAGLPLHFSHGVPALSTRDGQACAALADVLINGLSQDRVRRLLRRLPHSAALDRVPEDWSAGLPRRAGLFTLEHWRRALAATRELAHGRRSCGSCHLSHPRGDLARSGRCCASRRDAANRPEPLAVGRGAADRPGRRDRAFVAESPHPRRARSRQQRRLVPGIPFELASTPLVASSGHSEFDPGQGRRAKIPCCRTTSCRAEVWNPYPSLIATGGFSRRSSGRRQGALSSPEAAGAPLVAFSRPAPSGPIKWPGRCSVVPGFRRMRSASLIVCWRDHWKPPSAREWPQAAFAGGIGDGRRSRPTTGPCDQHIQRSNTHLGACTPRPR